VTSTTGGSYSAAGSKPQGYGWLLYASVILGLVGTFNVIDGIVALSKSKFFVADATYIFSDLRTWGWIVLVIGILQIVAAWTIVNGSSFGRWFGIATASLNAVAQLGFLHAYPIWALSAFAMDLLVIYALAVYGGSRARTAQ
jgi:hypothetical protein